ncbi:SDR family NAD(P)-dependent oxidoreductase [Clostridium estertheticum]|uniref:SDR family NAD(P)-dependent oxidoreductase n=1 Tax=Clostridium estertheticum TaxID=238834 RepID=UPI0013E92639|nr:SDR family NAD(P)-dependent oxidoreductase [Clostridium estertheticum]MBZ9689698.1 SDR family NAD(P)-dependent oxidoreductase [Clostridium estertheticum]
MGKVLITGGNKGLGHELVRVFYENNYEVFTVVRTVEAAEELKYEFKQKCHPIVVDLRFDDSIEKIKSVLAKITTEIDIVINNAGVPGREYEIENVLAEEIEELLNIHCLGVVRTVQGTIDFLRNSTNPRIINISSRLGSLSKMSLGEFGSRNFSYSYRIAKAAQNMLTICLNNELKSQGICVNAIHPGKLKTTSGSSDADLNPNEAAERIFNWIETLKISDSGSFTQPFVGDWPW